MKQIVMMLALAASVFADENLLKQAPDYAVQHWEQEYAELENEIEKRKDQKALSEERVSPSNILNRHSLIWDTDRDALDVVLRRTRALLEHIKAMSNAPDLAESEQELSQLEAAARQTDLAKSPATDAQRLALFKAARALQRQVALANPLLNDIDEILFSKGEGYEGLLQTAPWGQINSVLGRDWTKEDWETYNFKTPEGEKPTDEVKRPGLFVLSGFKTGKPETRPLFMDSKIENGPNAGKLLVNFPGNYQFNFDLSYDGKEVVFAKCLGDRTSYHIFKGNVDGSGLRQLTNCWFPDWDPCFLPNGRIAFISLRRWISARCQSWKPQACGTLFSMKDDGSDLYPISWHETSEFFPTVNNDGMLVYTRWDYIDRDFNAGQHMWTCAPDGRDPRAPHGNYTQPFSTQDETRVLSGELYERPWAEFHIRAIPNTSGKYIGIAGIHHGSTPGVPILIDTSIKDDSALSQIKILRGNNLPREEPRARGLEARYTTPWPLSEDYFLATIYAEAGILSPTNPRILYKPQGIVLMDKFGNTEMLMAGQGLSARPLKSRETPPEIPTATWQGERKGASDHKRATISIMNIYESDLPFPEGTEITDLRIIQVVQKPWSSDIIHRKTMGYSFGGMGRMILGTVPVELDGSAYFEAPVEREIYFQALDSQGMAVQSMRSATYVHPGEQLSCIGCHEEKTRAPSITAAPMAMMRPPSKITPEKVPGAAPFSFARLVQPVLDNSCLPCHHKEGKGFQSSRYADLKEFAFYFDADGGSLGLHPKHGGYRTTPGRFGARESRMGKALLNDTHQKAMQAGDISPDDFHRVVLWLDANSMELGSYHDDEAQRAGKVIWPVLEADPANPTGVEHDRPLP
ncbi:MAG TPA: hypothetical protein DCR55_16100 [Lentisphaeria bacterium]|nr:hypothetical protein [Lentisphaeria bacterium]